MSGFPMVRLKWSVALKNRKSSGQLPYIGLEHVTSWTGRYSPSFDSDSFSDAGSRHFEHGDVLFGKLRPYLAKAAVLSTSGSCTSELLVLEPRSYDKRFLLYWILSPPFIDDVDRSTYGAQMPRASWDYIGNVPSPLPPLPTQRAISDFLDRKTAAIDALIEKKERLLELLAEKRAALIHRAVTKGLDPDVPMKDSGVPWIGEIPAHWDVKRLKYASPSIMVGIVVQPAKHYVEAGVPCPRSLNVRPMQIDDRELVYISPESSQLLSKSQIHQGDLLCVRTGQPGTTAVVDARFDGANCIDLIIIRRSSLMDSTYLALVMNSDVARDQYTQGGTGAIQVHFNVGTAKDLLVPVPPRVEQQQLASTIVGWEHRHNALTSRLDQHLDKLREYRQALITAAVTGQLDISGAP